MSEENINQDTLRDTIEANFDAMESAASQVNDSSRQDNQQPESLERARDERGRFASKETPAPQEAQPQVQQPPEAIRPKGWKKDYWEAYDKLNSGQPLTPEESKALASYAVQRENEYASGVSTYRSEAEQARLWNEAVSPIMHRLQAHGVQPHNYVGQLIQVDNVLTSGSPQQKIQALAQIASSYGIPLSVLAQGAQSGGIDSATNDLLAKIQHQDSELKRLNAWIEKQDNSSIESQIKSFSESGKAPHFEAVRATMGKLLESGMASTLEDAYEQAVYLNPETRALELSRQQENTDKIAAANRAKQAAISVKQSAPRGKTANSVDPSDLRATLEAHAAEIFA